MQGVSAAFGAGAHRAARRRARIARALVGGAIAGLVALSTGCTETEPRPKARQADRPLITRDMPSILRGTVGAESRWRGNQPVRVAGYGIVVGLNGTGSSDVSPAVRGVVEAEMSRRGVGKESSGMGWTTPSQMINDPNTAIVLVQGVLQPGMIEGSSFDVFVTALPGASTTSLEGGRLWTTDLRPGLPDPGAPDVQPVAHAAGDLFINPFADPAKAGEDSINRVTGRILAGGVVTERRDLVLALDNPSHSRARSLVGAINARFPQGPDDSSPAAWGLNEELIRITIPEAWSERRPEFMELVMASRGDLAFPDEWARRYAMAMASDPDLALELSWRLQALGKPSLPFVRDLYDYPELVPRLSALRVGARLNDALVTPHLKEIAASGSPALRTQAIGLLADLGPDPQVNEALRALLDSPAIDVRLAAYEALSKRADPRLNRRIIENKFILDSVPAADPLVYVSQQGKPRIVIFGAGLTIKRPVLASGWGDRLMVAADSPGDDLRIYYLDHRSGRGVTNTVDPALTEVIEFLARKMTPEQPAPGLNLTYSQVVGALHELWKAGAIPAGFVAEQDRLAAEILRSLSPIEEQERPETEGEEPAPHPGVSSEEAAAAKQAEAMEEGAPAEPPPGEQVGPPAPKKKRSYVVPVPTPQSPK